MAFGGAQGPEFPRQIGHVGADIATLPLAGLVADIDPVGAGVLRDDEEFLGPRGDQLLSLAQARIDPPARQLAAQIRDDAEGAGVIAALGDLEVAVVARGELDVRLRDQVDERALARRRVDVDGLDHLFVLMRPGDRQHLRMGGADRVGFLAHAAGHDHAAVLRDGLADRSEALFLGGIEKAAGVDQHDVCARIILGKSVAIGAQTREDPLGIDERLGAAEADHADLLLLGQNGGSYCRGRVHCGAPLHCVGAQR